MHEDVLRGNRLNILSDGNGTREVRWLGKRREVKVGDGSNGKVKEVTEFLEEEFGVKGELAVEFAREMCEKGV